MGEAKASIYKRKDYIMKTIFGHVGNKSAGLFKTGTRYQRQWDKTEFIVAGTSKGLIVLRNVDGTRRFSLPKPELFEKYRAIESDQMTAEYANSDEHEKSGQHFNID